jgi:CMP-N-acetylneuraminic acid synthetase
MPIRRGELGVKHLGLITARGGSKGVCGKNIRPLLGLPLIAYTIRAARESRAFDRLVLSTDDIEIARVGLAYGAEVPFRRPGELATDSAPSHAVVMHCLEALELTEGYRPDAVTILQPTSPFRPPDQICAFLRTLESALAEGLDGALSLTDSGQAHPVRMYEPMDGTLPAIVARRAFPRMAVAPNRRQDLSSIYLISGAYFGLRPDVPARLGTCKPDTVMGFVVENPFLSVNIDTAYDFALAELLMAHSQDPDFSYFQSPQFQKAEAPAAAPRWEVSP